MKQLKKAAPFLIILLICAILALSNWFSMGGGDDAGYVWESIYLNGRKYVISDISKELPSDWSKTAVVTRAVTQVEPFPEENGTANAHQVGEPIYTHPDYPDQLIAWCAERDLYLHYVLQTEGSPTGEAPTEEPKSGK